METRKFPLLGNGGRCRELHPAFDAPLISNWVRPIVLDDGCSVQESGSKHAASSQRFGSSFRGAPPREMDGTAGPQSVEVQSVDSGGSGLEVFVIAL